LLQIDLMPTDVCHRGCRFCSQRSSGQGDVLSLDACRRNSSADLPVSKTAGKSLHNWRRRAAGIPASCRTCQNAACDQYQRTFAGHEWLQRREREGLPDTQSLVRNQRPAPEAALSTNYLHPRFYPAVQVHRAVIWRRCRTSSS